MRNAAAQQQGEWSDLAMAYWVIGGEYRDGSFAELAPGAQLERIGPFASYDEAKKAWAARAWATVDNALMRFRIVEGEEKAA
jgi:hypothetical protein